MGRKIAIGVGRLGVSAPNSAFNPASLNPSIWYDTSQLSKLWQDSARTVAAVVDQPVGARDDLSGNNDHQLQATTAQKPILREAPAGQFYLEYDNIDDVLLTAGSPSLPVDTDIYFAGRYTTTGMCFFNSIGGTPWLGAVDNTASAIDNGAGTPSATVNGVAVPGGSGVTRLDVQGVWATGINKVFAAINADMTGFTALGQGLWGGGYSVIRDYGVIARATFTAGERANINTWLGAKMGIVI